MHLTYVVRPKEGPESRKPSVIPVWSEWIKCTLRVGFFVQLVGLIGLLGTGIFAGTSGSLYALVDGQSRKGEYSAMVFSFTMFLGGFLLATFRGAVDDDPSLVNSRGYCSGSKFLALATTLDLISWATSAMGIYSTIMYSPPDIEGAKLVATEMIFIYARIMHAVALMCYAATIFMMETYHSVGCGEGWVWVIVPIFKCTAVLELILAVCPGNQLGTVTSFLYLAGVTAAFLWSVIFEPIMLEKETKMEESIIRSEYYKSKNAMAYYGSQVTS